MTNLMPPKARALAGGLGVLPRKFKLDSLRCHFLAFGTRKHNKRSSILTEVPRSLSRFLMTPLFTELEYCKKKLLRAKRGFSFKFFFLHFYIIKYIFYITVLCPKSCLLLREIRRLRSGFLSLQSQPSMPIGKWHL